jgi:hypothetical protein
MLAAAAFPLPPILSLALRTNQKCFCRKQRKHRICWQLEIGESVMKPLLLKSLLEYSPTPCHSLSSNNLNPSLFHMTILTLNNNWLFSFWLKFCEQSDPLILIPRFHPWPEKRGCKRNYEVWHGERSRIIWNHSENSRYYFIGPCLTSNIYFSVTNY